MIDVNELRRGTSFEEDGELYQVQEYTHNKPGRGKATIRVQVRNLRTGTIRELTFNSGDRVQNVRLETVEVEYLYADDRFLHFMNTDTYEQPVVSVETFGDDILYLREGLRIKLSSYEGEILSYELPPTVEQEVVEAENAVAGDTATSASKQVRTATGLAVQAPMFVTVGDVIRIDTRTGDYVTRVTS
ncbi:MAG: elongation factor P [Chloroflexi bacterium]|nr:elongation factor P [Chloroflexota bacterium]